MVYKGCNRYNITNKPLERRTSLFTWSWFVTYCDAAHEVKRMNNYVVNTVTKFFLIKYVNIQNA